MLGSTWWLEERLASGDVPALAFVNVDSAVRANDLYVSATPGLRGPLAEVLELVRDPASGGTLEETSGEPDLPGFSSDAAPFLGFSATPVAELGFGRWYGSYHTLYDTVTWMKRFGDPGFVRSATLSRILALYAGMLATPRFFPLRFGELADFASRQIREIQARHPSSIGWVPQIARPLASQIDLFEAEARAWDARVRAAGGPGKDAVRFDRLVSVALGAFAAPGAAFGRGCRLWGPSLETGCGAAARLERRPPEAAPPSKRGTRCGECAERDRDEPIESARVFSRASRRTHTGIPRPCLGFEKIDLARERPRDLRHPSDRRGMTRLDLTDLAACEIGELADFASRQIREIQARHPSSIGWVPQIARPLASQIDLFEAEARAWDARVRAAGGPGKDAGRFDRLVSVALGAFAAPGAAFGRGCRLWGPSLETGCGAAAVPALEEAIGRNDRVAAAKEFGRLAGAFSRARDQLVMANRVAEGTRRPPRPTPGISRKQ